MEHALDFYLWQQDQDDEEQEGLERNSCQYYDGQIYSEGDCVLDKDGYCIFCGKHYDERDLYPKSLVLSGVTLPKIDLTQVSDRVWFDFNKHKQEQCKQAQDEGRELYPFDEFLNADWCDHGASSQNECLICNLDLRQSIMDSV